MTPIRLRRSALYMPGTNARAMEKARSLAADALIFDLQDSVAPEMKETARAQIVAALRAGGYGEREVVVRVNQLWTQWGAGDVDAVAQSGAHGVLLPKVRAAEDIRALRAALKARRAPPMAIWAMMETPQAVVEAAAIAAEARAEDYPLAVFVLGANDLAKETRAAMTRGRAPMLPWLSMIVAAARAHGVDILDSVYNDFADALGFAEECAQGKALGMDGKSLIHPSQIGPCNAAFSPQPDELEWAERVVAAFEAPENALRGVISLDRRMVERLHVDMARRTLAMAAAIRAREGAG